MPRMRAFEKRSGAGLQQKHLMHRRSFTSLSAASALAGVTFLLLGTGHAFAQTTVHVPADQPSIQAGIDAAANGDTVLVAPGTYNENIDFKGKAITVTSSGGPSMTIIDGGSHDGTAVVTFKTQELRTSILSGFTIQHGGTQTATSQASGGVYIHAAAPVIANNIISANRCSGIFANGGALLQANIVASTRYQNPGTDSSCQQGGAGIVVSGTTTVGPYTHVELLGNTVIGNAQSASVGGIDINAAEGTFLQNNIITGNTGAAVGAIQTENVNSVVISNNLIYGNSAGASSPGFAGGLELRAPLATVSGNTFAANSLLSGISAEAASEINLSAPVTHINLANNIIAGYATSFPALNCSASSSGGTPAFDHNDIYDPNGKAYGGACSDQTGVSGNISADPLFVAASSSIFHLSVGSPAIDSGNNAAYLMPPIDLEGQPRIQDATQKGLPIVDMGAYEYPGALDGGPYNTVITSSLNPAAYGQQVTFTAYVTTTSPSVGNPSGTVTFTDGGTVLGTQPTQLGSPLTATASFSTSTLAAGSHPITATFNPPAGAQPASASLTETVTGFTTTTTVASSLNPSPSGQPVTFTATVTSNSASGGTPTGTLRFLEGGVVLATQTLTGSGATSATANYTTSTLSAGTHTITATYDGSAGLAASSGTVTQTVLGNSATTTAITGSPNPALLGKTVTFAVTVTSTVSGAGSPTGTVTLTLGGTTVLGTQTVTASGASTSQATFNVSSLPVGGQAIQATYNATGSFLNSTAAMTENIVLPADFTLTPGQIALSIQTQHHATTTLTLTSLSTFQDSVALSCGSLPVYVTCRLTPATTSLTPASTATVSLYIDTDSVIGYAALQQPDLPGVPRRVPPATGLAVLAPAVWFAGLRRRFRKGAPAVRILLLLVISCVSLIGLAGCGSIILPVNIPPSATPGTYTIPITATGAATGITHTSVLTLTITP